MKIIKNSIKLSLILLLGNVCTYATTWETIDKGYWTDTAVWLNGAVPDTMSGDTFVINHPIVISQDLIFTSRAYILITQNGGICGHQKGTLLNSAKLITYGILELDDLVIDNGFMHCLAGNVILSSSAKVIGVNGKLEVEVASSFAVGFWFECMLPDYAFVTEKTLKIDKQMVESRLQIHPNPFTHSITLQHAATFNSQNNKPYRIIIYDYLGKEAFETDLQSLDSNQIILDFLKPGIYVVAMTNGLNKYYSRIVKQ
jgi:hypothetical protein